MKHLLLLLLPLSLAAQNSNVNNAGSARAVAFINELTDIQKKKAVFPFENMSRYEWDYLPASTNPRTGIAIKDLNSTQKLECYNLLQAFLSSDGYVRTKTIINFEYLLRELEQNNGSRIPENYFVAVYGNPGRDSTWGWKFSGHHLALNFTVVNDQLAFAPFFFGANPAEVKAGTQKGLRIMKAEEDLGFELVNSLTPVQKQTAIFQAAAFADIVTGSAAKVEPLEPVGLPVKDMTPEQATVLNKLIVAYLSSMPGGIANKRMKKIASEDMDAVRFGWAGGLVRGKPHYYRVQGKTFLIEFDNTQNNANHIHAVWRDFNGDFGRDLLRDHYKNSKH